MKKIPDEIKRGMELLDEKAPGWCEKVDPSKLNMAYCFTCILGQVFGEYHYGLRVLGIASSDAESWGVDEEINEQAENLGFQSKVRDGICLNYDDLNRAWKEALQVKNQ